MKPTKHHLYPYFSNTQHNSRSNQTKSTNIPYTTYNHISTMELQYHLEYGISFRGDEKEDTSHPCQWRGLFGLLTNEGDEVKTDLFMGVFADNFNSVVLIELLQPVRTHPCLLFTKNFDTWDNLHITLDFEEFFKPSALFGEVVTSVSRVLQLYRSQASPLLEFFSAIYDMATHDQYSSRQGNTKCRFFDEKKGLPIPIAFPIGSYFHWSFPDQIIASIIARVPQKAILLTSGVGWMLIGEDARLIFDLGPTQNCIFLAVLHDSNSCTLESLDYIQGLTSEKPQYKLTYCEIEDSFDLQLSPSNGVLWKNWKLYPLEGITTAATTSFLPAST